MGILLCEDISPEDWNRSAIAMTEAQETLLPVDYAAFAKRCHAIQREINVKWFVRRGGKDTPCQVDVLESGDQKITEIMP